MHAELDTDQYATGITVSDARMTGLPITHHDWHGEWNYTLKPDLLGRTSTARTATAGNDRSDRAWLAHSALVGLPPGQWDNLIDRLEIVHYDQREADLLRQRGGPRQMASGVGRHPVLTLTERVALTLLHQRFQLSQTVLAGLFAVTPMTASRAIRQIAELLDQIGHRTPPAATRLHSGADLTSLATTLGIVSTSQAKSAI